MTVIEFFVEGKPRPRGSKTAMPIYNRKTGMPMMRSEPRVAGGRVERYAQPIINYKDAAKGSEKWMKTIRAEATLFEQDPLWDDAVTMLCVFCYQLPKSYLSTAKGKEGQPRDSAPEFKVTMPDVLKLGRAVEDALKGVIYTDDARVVQHTSMKTWSQYQGVYVSVLQGAVNANVDEQIAEYFDARSKTHPF